MPTEITQIDEPENRRTTLHMHGEMARGDAELVERIAGDIFDETGNSVVIDLADLDLIDGEAASILLRIERKSGFSLVGAEIFLQTIVDHAEGRS